MNRQTKNILNIAFMIVLFVVTLYVIFSNNDMEEVVGIIQTGNVHIIIIASVMMLVSTMCEALIIYIMMRNMNENITFRRCAKYSFIGFYYCAITPSASGGQPAQIVYMKKDGYKLTTSSIIIMTIVMVYKLVLIGFIGFICLLNYHYVMESIESISVFFCIGTVVNILFIAFIILLFFSPMIVDRMLNLIIKMLCKIKLIKHPEGMVTKLSETMKEYVVSTNYIKEHWGILLPVLIITIIQRLLLFAISYMIYRYFGLTEQSFLNILTLQVILSTSVDVLPVPGGIGASELAFKLLFHTIYSELLLVPAMLTTRFINFYFMLILSAVISLTAHFLMVRNEFRKEDVS